MVARHMVLALFLVTAIACRGGNAHVQTAPWIQSEAGRKVQIFVLPPGYRGPVMVIYDQVDGARPRSVDGEVVYDVPADGIVRTALPEEVLAGARVQFVFGSRPALFQYHNCTAMRLQGLATDPAAVCWLAIQVGETGTPDHAVYIVTDWVGIPDNYERGARMLDSLFFGGKGISRFKWAEPKKPSTQMTT
ncbi:MAG TPA: hypothetical protein VGN73_03900 [Gemmatimonadaceae bacterium]|nr:hypothetical protein [Gemmatimonadaceae bacterium]